MQNRHNQALEAFQEALGYHFQNQALLEEALVHRSILNEKPGLFPKSNERMEFLGDAVLELLSSEELFQLYPKDPEGELSRKRALAVCEDSFARLGTDIGLPDLLHLGHGEELQHGRQKPSLIADAFEAVCGAIYLDGGMDFLRSWFVDQLHGMMPMLAVAKEETDAKSAVQRLLSQRGEAFEYVLLEESGPPHLRHFRMALEVEGRKVAEGEGTSKKRAEAEAAAHALQVLEQSDATEKN